MIAALPWADASAGLQALARQTAFLSLGLLLLTLLRPLLMHLAGPPWPRPGRTAIHCRGAS